MVVSCIPRFVFILSFFLKYSRAVKLTVKYGIKIRPFLVISLGLKEYKPA